MTTDRQMADVADAEIRGYLEQIETIRRDARALAEELSAAQFNWRPGGTRWSIGQCLEHITLTVRLYPAKIEAMLEQARQRQAEGQRAFREGAISRWIVSSMEPPPRLRTRTMRRVEPASHLPCEETLAAFDREQASLAEFVRRADGLSLRHARTPSPFLPILRFTLGQVFAMTLAHTRRHLWQARQVRQDPAFPATGAEPFTERA